MPDPEILIFSDLFGCFDVAVHTMPSQGPFNHELLQQLDQALCAFVYFALRTILKSAICLLSLSEACFALFHKCLCSLTNIKNI